jgi:hypothetical protein
VIVYAIAKYLLYSLWCYVGLRLFAVHVAPIGSALSFGAIRWLLGLGLGLIVFVAIGSVTRSSLAALYFAIYTPLRVLEWTVMMWLMLRHGATVPLRTRLAWVLGGIVVSFASDAVSPDGLAGRFCVGRCLC